MAEINVQRAIENSESGGLGGRDICGVWCVEEDGLLSLEITSQKWSIHIG